MAARTTSKKASPNVQSTLEYFRSISRELEEEKESYTRKRTTLGIQVFVVIEDYDRGVPSTPDADENAMRTETNQLLSHINELKLRIVSHKIEHVANIIARLEMMAETSQATPADLLPREYEDWIEKDDDLAQWQLQLLRIHEFTSTLRRRRALVDQQVEQGARGASRQQRMLVADSIAAIQHCIASFVAHIPDSITMQLDAIISPTQGKVTTVSRHIDSYVNECARFRETDPTHQQGGAPDPVGQQNQGCHPLRYQDVMGGLVGYLSELCEARLGLDRSSIYLVLEAHIMPRVKNYALPHVRKTEEDRQLTAKYEEFQHITLANISVNKTVQNGAFGELLPFADAIATLKASYFSSNPTKKLHSIAKAAELVLKRLREVFKAHEVDGDLVLDVWVYILIKAKINDLATTLAFLEAYSDPAMSLSQLGYCLTTCIGAMNFIISLTPDQLKRPEVSPFVTCEKNRFDVLCSKDRSPFTMVREECVLRGYKMAVIPHWMFDKKRFYRSFLVKTGQDEDIVSVAVVRAQDSLQDQQKEFIYQSFTTPPFDEVKVEETPHGLALVLDQKDIAALSKANCLLVPCEIHFADIEDRLAYIIPLLRLGSEKVDFPGTPPSYRAASRLQVPTAASVGPLHVLHPRPVTMGLKGADGRQVKERDKTAVGLSNAADCQQFLDPSYVKILENNFIRNHLKGEPCVNPRKKAKELVQEAQVYLKMLNFLSQFHPSTGVYCDATVDAVQRFQEECNKLLGGFPFPASGHLTPTTLHRLRGDMLDITSRLTRLGFTDFPDPLNQSVENIALMKETIALIQRKWQIAGSYREGVFCRATLCELDRKMHILTSQSYRNKSTV